MFESLNMDVEKTTEANLADWLALLAEFVNLATCHLTNLTTKKKTLITLDPHETKTERSSMVSA